jgi:hypothetical protein
MAVKYYTPGREELLAAMRREFAFLIPEYGYVELVERPERYTNPYSILFRRAPVEVLVEGISYGGGTTIAFRIRNDVTQPPTDQFCISWLAAIRRPDLQVPVFPDQRGQLLQLPKLAFELRAVADDLLRGDLSLLPQVRSAIAKAQAEGQEAEKIDQFRRAETRSMDAFRRRDYARVIRELEPHRDVLNASSRKRLEIAKSRA